MVFVAQLLADAKSTAFGSCYTQHSRDGDRQFTTGLRFRVDGHSELILAAVQIAQPWVRRPWNPPAYHSHTLVVFSCQDILEGGNLRNALQELQQIIITPIKAYSPPSAGQATPDSSANQESASTSSEATKTGADKEPASEAFQPPNPPPCDGDSSATPISEEDIAGQFTRVMGKGDGLLLDSHLCNRMLYYDINCYAYLHSKMINDLITYRCVTLQG